MPYSHPNKDPNLNNLHHAMQYRDDGTPEVRVNVDGITLSGPITVGNVEISNDTGNPIPVNGTVELGASTLSALETVTVNQGTSPWAVNGTVNIGTMPAVEIANEVGNPINVNFQNSQQTDAFGRLRISSPFTLFDSFHRYQDNGKANSFTAGTASITHEATSSSLLMTIGTATGDSAIRETSRVFAYQPGKSLLILITFTMNEAKAGLRQRAGYFDTDNGIFLEQDGTDIYIVKRSSSSGSIVETRIPKAGWNVNAIPGLDLSKSQIFYMDIEWLGVGSVRTGFVIDGVFVDAHYFHHANTGTSTYMTTACLPGRVEITNTASTASSSTYRQICFSVISEGGYELRGRPRSAGHPISTPYALSTPNQEYPIMSIRLKSDRLGAIVVPKTFSFAPTAAANYKFKIISAATITGGTWVSAGTDSNVEYNISGTGYTGGTELEAGYIISTNQAASSPLLKETAFKYQLERNTFTNTAYTFTIVAACSGNNQTAYCAIDWEEIT